MMNAYLSFIIFPAMPTRRYRTLDANKWWNLNLFGSNARRAIRAMLNCADLLDQIFFQIPQRRTHTFFNHL